MKTWYSYGSEHSASLVIIGEFKSNAEAITVDKALHKMQSLAINSEGDYKELSRIIYDEYKIDIRESDLEGMIYDHGWEQRDNKVIVHTDEVEIQAIVKSILDNQGKVQIYSTHYHNTGNI